MYSSPQLHVLNLSCLTWLIIGGHSQVKNEKSCRELEVRGGESERL